MVLVSGVITSVCRCTTLSSSVPPSTVTATALGTPDMLNTGLNLTLQCDVTLFAVTDAHVAISVEWRRFRRLKDSLQLNFSALQKYTPISYSGNYSCTVFLSPKAQYTYLRSQTGHAEPLWIASQCYSTLGCLPI